MKLIDYITDLLIDFDEMGFAPTTLCPNPEAYAIEWRNKITKAFKELTEENERLSKQVADLQDELKCEKETNEHLCGEYMSAKADTQKTKMSHGRRQIERYYG